MNNHNLIQQLDEAIESRDYALGRIVEPARDRLVEALLHCFVNHNNVLESILLHSLDVIQTLDKTSWREIIVNTDQAGRAYLWPFIGFLLIYCEIDEGYLCEIGLPHALIEEVVRRRRGLDFPYYHASEHVELNPKQLKLNDLKREAIEAAGVSEEEEFQLFKMFTEK